MGKKITYYVFIVMCLCTEISINVHNISIYSENLNDKGGKGLSYMRIEMNPNIYPFSHLKDRIFSKKRKIASGYFSMVGWNSIQNLCEISFLLIEFCILSKYKKFPNDF